eukprot:TRINITY_DN5846_c0_g1_i1.p1 TRINITY_DN5846_c0_g1~~TRINITY_DN5846_c0_g1_i1.p1  ORF type:complete len:847 (+),score=168.55 TRINITY_DN5846_c0_g1_i1:44-2584(+)
MSNFQEILDTVLGYALSENRNNEAYEQARQWELENPGLFAQELAVYLSNTNMDQYRRQMAGLFLKNFLHSEDSEKRENFIKRWSNGLSEDIKVGIRQSVYNCLNDPADPVRKVSSQVLGKISVIDFPEHWPNLMSMLLHNIISGDNPVIKVSSLDAIGYICEDMVELFPEKMAPITDVVLTAFVHSMRNEASPVIQKAACNTLINALEFCKSNFDTQDERKLLMDVIIQSTKEGSQEISMLCFHILGQIACIYYEYMNEFIQVLFELTIDAIKNAEEGIAKQATEFWSSLAEEERVRLLSGNEIFSFLLGAREFLLPVLFIALTKQESDDYDIDELTLPMTASICINSISKLLGTEAIPHLMPLINTHITSQDWRYQEASVMALSAILENQTHSIYDVINQAIPVLLSMLQDSNQKIALRDSVAWTLGRICKFHPSPVFPHAPKILEIVGAFIVNNGPPRIVSHCCWIILSFCTNFPPLNNPIIPYYSYFLLALYNTGKRSDGYEHSLSMYAFDALNELVTLGHTETHFKLIQELLKAVGNDLTELATQNPDRDTTQMQEYLCTVIQAIINRSGIMFSEFFDSLMNIFITLLNTNFTNIAEEVLLSICAILNASEENFNSYVPTVMPYVLPVLGNVEDPNANIAAVGLIDDLIRCIPSDVMQYLDTIVSSLITNVQEKTIDRSVKPVSLSCLGDIALSIQLSFQRYLKTVFELLAMVSNSLLEHKLEEDSDTDIVSYVNELRNGLLDCFTGIFIGVKCTELENLADDNSSLILQILINIASCPFGTDELRRKCAGLLGDLVVMLGSRIRMKLTEQVWNVLDAISRSPVLETRNEAEWAKEVIKSIE